MHKTKANGTVITVVAITLVVSYICVKYKLSRDPFHSSSVQSLQRRRILLLYHTDHEELLKAGREILKQGPKDPMNYRYYGPEHIDGFPVPRGIRIPKVIRRLRPHACLINRSGYVVVQMKGGTSNFGVRIYPEGFTGKCYRFTPGKRELIPGLEYFDYKYREIPEYDKIIDYVIQNGQWIESNDVDPNENTN